MSELFKAMHNVIYNGYDTKNIMTKIATIKATLSIYDLYFPYTISDGERPDTIAYDYYGDSTYAWLVLIVNDIYDPYYGWPMTYEQFLDYLQKKYGTVYELQGQVHHYIYTGIGGDTQEEIARKNYWMSPTTYTYADPVDKSGWTSVSVYQYELDVNEAKRNIRLISNDYIKQIDKEIAQLFEGN